MHGNAQLDIAGHPPESHTEAPQADHGPIAGDTVHSARARTEGRYMNSDEQRADRWERLSRNAH